MTKSRLFFTGMTILLCAGLSCLPPAAPPGSFSDGKTWIQVKPPFPFRVTPQAVVYNNKLWVIGGYATGKPYNDVWRSD